MTDVDASDEAPVLVVDFLLSPCLSRSPLRGGEPRRSGHGSLGLGAGSRAPSTRRREPVVFRARRAHARSRGPQVWVMPRRAARHEFRRQARAESNGAPTMGNLKPLAPGKTWMSPDVAVRLRTMAARTGSAALLERPLDDGLVRSWPPGRQHQVSGSVLVQKYYVKGVTYGPGARSQHGFTGGRTARRRRGGIDPPLARCRCLWAPRTSIGASPRSAVWPGDRQRREAGRQPQPTRTLMVARR